jgi:hypothetical protein
MDVSTMHPGSSGPELMSKLNTYANAGARRGTGTSGLMTDSRGGGPSDPAHIGAGMSALDSAIPAKSQNGGGEQPQEIAQPGGEQVQRPGETTDASRSTVQPEDVHGQQFTSHISTGVSTGSSMFKGAKTMSEAADLA